MQVISRVVHVPRSEEAERLSTAEIRSNFLIEHLFGPGELHVAYVDLDRMLVGGVAPTQEVSLPAYRDFGTRYFTERRELGILNVGAPAAVAVGNQEYALDKLDCLYVGIAEQHVAFLPGPSGQSLFYFLSCPAHYKYPTAKVARHEVASVEVGDELHASKRCIRKCIHPGGLRSCQLVMGFTEVAQGSVWNTMAPHTHSRRTEVYFYFDLEREIAIHLMGRGECTRSLIVRDKQAVISPGWSLHGAAGTRNYKFVWGMAGENQEFDDMDPIAVQDLY